VIGSDNTAKGVTPNLTCMASPCRAGDIPSRPQREAGARDARQPYRMALVRPHGDKRDYVGIFIAPWEHSYPQPRFLPNPIRCHLPAHEAGDCWPIACRNGLPRHQLEADAIIDSWRSGAGELGRAHKFAS